MHICELITNLRAKKDTSVGLAQARPNHNEQEL